MEAHRPIPYDYLMRVSFPKKKLRHYTHLTFNVRPFCPILYSVNMTHPKGLLPFCIGHCGSLAPVVHVSKVLSIFRCVPL